MHPEHEASAEATEYERDRIAWNLPLPRRVRLTLRGRTIEEPDDDGLDQDDTARVESAA